MHYFSLMLTSKALAPESRAGNDICGIGGRVGLRRDFAYRGHPFCWRAKLALKSSFFTAR
jgi:hypothetical protein